VKDWSPKTGWQEIASIDRTPQPEHSCFGCKTYNWWMRKDGKWICGTCHPKPQENTGAQVIL